MPAALGVSPCKPKYATPGKVDPPHVTLYEAPVNENANVIMHDAAFGVGSMMPPELTILASSCAGGHMATVPLAPETSRELMPDEPDENTAHKPEQ